MDIASTRNKANEITSKIMNGIAIRGQRAVAKAVGVNESQITRWKETMIPKMGMLLAVLEWGVEDDDLARLAKQVALIFKKQKSPTAVTGEDSQLTLSF